MCIIFLASLSYANQNGENESRSYGLRGGYSSNPDQFVIGLQSIMGKTLGFARFAPSIDVGFGDNQTTLLLNGDLRIISLSPPSSNSSFYAGFGPNLAWFKFKNIDSDTEVGLSLFGGLTLPMGRSNRYNLEARYGIGDMPDFKILLGIYFGGLNSPDRK